MLDVMTAAQRHRSFGAAKRGECIGSLVQG
jgi:hypothetical protein